MPNPNPDVQWAVFFLKLEDTPPTLVRYDSTQGTPAECEAFRDHSVLCIFDKQFGGTDTNRIHDANRYVYLDDHEKWTGTSLTEIAEYIADGVPFSANLNGGYFPDEFFQRALAVAQTDYDFPNAVGEMAYGIEERLRFNAAVSREVGIRAGGVSIRDGIVLPEDIEE